MYDERESIISMNKDFIVDLMWVVGKKNKNRIKFNDFIYGIYRFLF